MPALTITNAYLNLVRDNMLGVAGVPSPKITYVAIGTGIQGTPATATRLSAEAFRKALTNAVAGAANGESIFNGLIAPTDSVGTAIAEIGFFAGAASGAANSGTLAFYGTYAHTHTSAESLQIQADSTGA